MKKIDVYVLKFFIKFFLVGLLAFVNIFILSELFRIIGFITEKKITIFDGFLLLLFGLPDIFVQVIPLGILLGGLMTANKMASSLEITAMKTTGVSFKRIVAAPIVFSLLLSFFMIWFNDVVVPYANKRVREIKHQDIYNVSISKTKSDVFSKGEGDYICYIRYIDGESNILNNIELVKMDEDFNGVDKIIIAKRGYYDTKLKKWTLYDVSINTIATRETVRRAIYEPELKETPSDFIRDKIRENEMNYEELKDGIAFMKRTGGEVKELMKTFYKRVAYPFAALIMALIGLALGSRFVRGANAVSVGLSVVIGYMYYIIMVVLEAVAQGGYISPILGAWLPNMLFISVAAISMYKAEY